MNAAVVDASVWVSRFVNHDAFHLASCLWLEDHLTNGGIVVAPAILLSEVAGPIARMTGDSSLAHAARQGLLRVRGLRIIPIDRRLGQAAAMLAADLMLRGADAIYIAVALSLSLPLVTWDEQQRTRGSVAVAVHTPKV